MFASDVRSFRAARRRGIAAAVAVVLTGCTWDWNSYRPRDAATDAAEAPNLLGNASFETGTDGWKGYQATLMRVADPTAPDGDYVARVDFSGTGELFTIEVSDAAVARVSAGEIYEATAYLRAASSASMGARARIALRQSPPSGADVTMEGSSVLLDETYRPSTLRLTAGVDGASLDLYVLHDGAIAGAAFFVDAVSLRRVAP